MHVRTYGRSICVDDMSLLKMYLCKRYICLKIFFKLMFVDIQLLQVVRSTFNANIKETYIFFTLNICIK
jgi:hypothetical protein